MKARALPLVAFLLTALTLLCASLPTFAQSPSLAVPQAIRDRLATEGRARVIVQYATAGQQQVGAGAARRVGARRAELRAQRGRLLGALRGATHRVVHEFDDAPFLALDIDAASLAELEAAAPAGARIFEDKLLAPTLAASIPAIEADRAHVTGINGAGAVIAVVDSGVDTTHAFFGGRVIDEACFASAESGGGGDCPNGQATQIGTGAGANCAFAPQACRHGTHVAGIAAGAGSSFSGVAPAANIISIQVFHASTDCLIFFEEFPCPRAFESDIVAALEHVYDLRDQFNIASVNMSLGGTAYDSACDLESPFFSAAINNLRSVDIATVAASGNDGLTIGIAEPACIAAAISVGATTTNDNEVAWFSNSSADLDLLAPGSLINSSIPGGGFEYLEGTSMAAPHVAGAFALYRQAIPAATVDEALASFVDTGNPVSDWRGGPTKPLIRVAPALGIESPLPTLSSVAPTAVVAYGPDFTLTVTGSDFVSSSVVRIDGLDQTTNYVSDTQLIAEITAQTLATAAPALAVTVFTPAPGGGTTAALGIDVLTSSLTVDKTTAVETEDVTVMVTNPPGGPGDWLALAPVGSPSSEYIAYTYVNVAAPTWTLSMPQAPGDYEFRLFSDYGYTQLAASPAITVVAAPPPDPSGAMLTVDTTTAAPGDSVTVTLAGGLGGARDWLSFASVGAAPASYIEYTYVGAGVTDRTWTVTMPSTPGDYEFRLFLNDSYTQVTGSPTVTVDVAPPPNPGNATLTVDMTTATPGASVTFTLADGPGGANDWLALAEVGAAPGSYIAFTYVGAGVTDRTWVVSMPNTPGDYEVRLFLDNGYTQAAVSPTVTVEAAPPPNPGNTTLTVDTTSAAPGGSVTVTLTDSPGGTYDWLALASVDAPASAYDAFTYVGAGVTTRDWTVTMPSTPGDYEFRLFLDNGYTQVAVSQTVTVEVPPPPDPGNVTLTVDTTTAAPGDSVTVTLTDGPGGALDWLALAFVGAPSGSYDAFTYVGAGVTTRDWTVTMPSTPGDYEFRLFLDNGYTQVAVSQTVTVEVPPPDPGNVTLTVDTTTAAPGDSVTVTLTDSPGGTYDWLALASVGAPAGFYDAFTYVGAGVTTRDWTVTMPSTPGDYEFRLFLDNSYTQAAVSPTVTSQ